MGSPPADLSFVRAIEEAEASTLRSPMANAAGSGLMEENVGLKRGCPSKEDIEDKENICEVRQDALYVPTFGKEVPLPMKKTKKAGVCNLRKSLAWNPAFFTDEGVLNPLELSVLSGPLAGSNENAIPEIDGEVSPSIGFQKSSDKSVVNDVEENNGGKIDAKSGMKNVKDRKLFSTPEASVQEEKQAQSLGKINSGRSIARSLPRSPAMNSQKRVANVNVTNPTSKIPKFMPMKSQAASLPATSRNTISVTKGSSKLNQSNASVTVNAEKSFGTKGLPSNLKKEIPSSKPSAHDMLKDVVRTKEHTEPKISSKIIPESSESVEVHGRTNSVGSGKAFPSYALYGQRVSGGLPPPGHVKPSALRMPSPSLGFFSQGKVSPSFGNHSQRKIENSSSNIPTVRKPISPKQIDDHRIICASAEQQSNNVNATTKSCAGTAIDGSIHRSSITNFSSSSATTANIHASVGKSSQIQFTRTTEGDNCESSSDELSQSGWLLVDNNSEVQSRVLEKNDRGRDDCGTTIKETEIIEQSLKVNFSPIKEADGNEISSTHISSELCSPKDLHEEKSKQLAEDGLKENSLTKNSPMETKKTETSSALSKDIQSAENSDSMLHVGSQCAARNVEITSSVETRSSLTCSKEQTAGSANGRSLISDHSLGQEKDVSVETIKFSSTSEEIQPNLPGDTNISIFLKAEGASMPDKNTDMDKSRAKAVLLKHQSHVVPFSDEWLAAVEAFGEEILELKTGPVQNSPPDKPLPEPSPWSPVKRQAQDIGPYDCTKYSKNLSSSDTTQ